jgi:hypothetical protein
MIKRASDPHVQLRDAASSLRTLGSAFVCIWLAIAYFLKFGAFGPRGPWTISVLASASAFLLAPGTLYHIGAAFIRRRERWAASLSMWTAVAQIVIVAVGLPMQIVDRNLVQMLFPVTVTMFFVPALIAQALVLRRSMEMIRRLPQAVHGFEAIPFAQRVDTTAPSPQRDSTVQVIDSVREK